MPIYSLRLMNASMKERHIVLALSIGLVVAGTLAGVFGYLLLTRPVALAACTPAGIRVSASGWQVVFSEVVLERGNARFSIVAATVCPPPNMMRLSLATGIELERTTGPSGRWLFPTSDRGIELVPYLLVRSDRG
jgi:hypothetical protein